MSKQQHKKLYHTTILTSRCERDQWICWLPVYTACPEKGTKMLFVISSIKLRRFWNLN